MNKLKILIPILVLVVLALLVKAEDIDLFEVDKGILTWKGTSAKECEKKYEDSLTDKKSKYLYDYYEQNRGYPTMLGTAPSSATNSLMYKACGAKANANKTEDTCKKGCYNKYAGRLLEVDRNCVDSKDCKDSVAVPAEQILNNCLGRCDDPEYELKLVTEFEREKILSGSWSAGHRRLCYSKECYTATGSCKEACSPPKDNKIAPISNYEELKKQGRITLSWHCKCTSCTEHSIVHVRGYCKIGTLRDDPSKYLLCYQNEFEGDLGASTLWATNCNYALYLIKETTVDPEQFLIEEKKGEEAKTPSPKELLNEFKPVEPSEQDILTGEPEWTEKEKIEFIKDVLGIDVKGFAKDIGKGKKAYIIYSDSMDWYRKLWVDGITKQSIAAGWLFDYLGYDYEIVYPKNSDEAFEYMADPEATAIFNFAHQYYSSLEEITPDELPEQFKQATYRLLKKKHGKEKAGQMIKNMNFESLMKELFVNFSCHSLDDLEIIKRTVKQGGVYYGHEGTLYPFEDLEEKIRSYD